MNYIIFISSILFAYLSRVSGQNLYYSQYYPSYYSPYYSLYESSYYPPSYFSQPNSYQSYHYYYPVTIDATASNNSTIKPYVNVSQQSSSVIANVTNMIDIYSIVFILMLVDIIVNL